MNRNICLVAGLTAVTAIVAMSCAGDKSVNNAAVKSLPPDAAAYADLKGRWTLDDIVISDSDHIRPSDELPGVSQYIVFEDSTYFIRTNCNTFSGTYAVTGDSIILGDGSMTERACDNMATEDAIRKILPDIATVYIENDSIARLGSSDPSEYIVLRKATDINPR